MIKLFFKKLLAKNRDMILEESQYIRSFMRLLMKYRNTGIVWTQEETHDLKSYVKRLSLHVPVLIIIVLPFGLVLLPILAEILDRRKKSRKKSAHSS
jgi:hypothetical protein